MTPTVGLAGRVERYDDANQVIVATGTRDDASSNGAFRATGASLGIASLGIDVSPQSRLLWRTELRGFANRTAIFPDGVGGSPTKTNGFVVSSLAVTF